MGQGSGKDVTKGLTEEKEEREYFLDEDLKEFKSPLILSFDEKFVFNAKNDIGSVNKLRNYGTLPVNVIHHLLMFNQPMDLFNLFSTCKLFHEVSSTNHFWRQYYQNYYQIKPDQGSKKSDFDLNWKKMFYRRFRQDELAEHRLMRQYEITINKIEKPIEIEESLVFGDMGLDNQPVGVYGKGGCGLRSFFYHLLLDKHPTEEERGEEDVKQLDLIFHKKKVIDPDDESLVLLQAIFSDSMEEIVKKNTKETLYKKMRGYLVCFDFGDRSSFDILKKFVGKIMKESSKLLLNDPKKHRYPIIVLGLKSDLSKSRRKVKKKEVVDFVRKKKLKGFIAVSSLRSCNIKLPFLAFARMDEERKKKARDDIFLGIQNIHSRMLELNNEVENIGRLLDEDTLIWDFDDEDMMVSK